MGERIAVKPGSTFERTSSQKKQLALQTERSTVGISLFQDIAASDASLLAADSPSSRSQSQEEVVSSNMADAGQGEAVFGSSDMGGVDQSQDSALQQPQCTAEASSSSVPAGDMKDFMQHGGDVQPHAETQASFAHNSGAVPSTSHQQSGASGGRSAAASYMCSKLAQGVMHVSQLQTAVVLICYDAMHTCLQCSALLWWQPC